MIGAAEVQQIAVVVCKGGNKALFARCESHDYAKSLITALNAFGVKAEIADKFAETLVSGGAVERDGGALMDLRNKGPGACGNAIPGREDCDSSNKDSTKIRAREHYRAACAAAKLLARRVNRRRVAMWAFHMKSFLELGL